MNKRCSSYRQKRHENGKKKETKDEISLFKVTFCGGSSWSSTSLNWEIPRLESALSRCQWRCFLRRLEPNTLLRPHHSTGWGPGTNKTRKERTSCWWILPFTLSSSPSPSSYNIPPSCLLWGKQLWSTIRPSDIQHSCHGQHLHYLEAMKPQKPWTKTDLSSLGCMTKKMFN